MGHNMTLAISYWHEIYVGSSRTSPSHHPATICWPWPTEWAQQWKGRHPWTRHYEPIMSMDPNHYDHVNQPCTVMLSSRYSSRSYAHEPRNRLRLSHDDRESTTPIAHDHAMMLLWRAQLYWLRNASQTTSRWCHSKDVVRSPLTRREGLPWSWTRSMTWWRRPWDLSQSC